jgi:hypothetical protein
MGTNKPLFFLCAKEHSARNLLLLLNTNRIVSDTYLTSSRSREPRFHPGSRPHELCCFFYIYIKKFCGDGIQPLLVVGSLSESWMKTHLFSTYNRLSGTRGSIASVNYNRTRYMTSPLQLPPFLINKYKLKKGAIEAGCFAYPAPHQRSVMGEIGGG